MPDAKPFQIDLGDRPHRRRSDRSGNRRGGGSRRRSRRFSDRAFLQGGDHLTRGHDVAFLPQNLAEDAIRRGGNVQHDLVGFQINEVFTPLDRLSRLFLPVDQGAVGDGFGQGGDFHFYSHFSFP